MDIPDKYDSKIEEPKWQAYWQAQKLFKFDPKSKKPVFSIDTPPPTVSGKMHMGHAFSYTQQDFIARFQRMMQKNVFYPFGTDDNGLPTERLVEKLKSVKSTRMDRNDFVTLCDNTIKEIKPKFIQSWIDVGMSCDFEGSYSTIDRHCQKTSQSSFIDLFKKDLVFREETPITWCTSCQTAIAQAEFENVDINSHFNDIIFKSERDLTISTTRPELLPACVAIFFNPEDERYKDLKGKTAKVPLFNYEVPIMTDESVALDVGTGLMMVCTFGDKEDVAKWYKYSLPLRIAITKDGKLNELGQKYANLPLKEARKQIIEDLKAESLLINQKSITHAVNVHDKCGTEIEFMKTPQWYIKILDKKQELIKAGNSIAWYPEHMKSRYINWVENLNWNWCISRQRHFGVPFPVWYCKKCNNIIVAEESSLPVDPLITQPTTTCKCGSNEFIPEKDVMDTWATSSVSPQIITNWKDKGGYDVEFKQLYPMTLRPQAHDIIRTWAFYTITKGLYNCDNIPWKNIMISGHAQDPHGRKMSKSLGNVIEPEDMIKKYSADALRYWAASSKLGDDLPFQDKDLMTGQKTVTKLWNASKFSMMHLADYNNTPSTHLELMDRWLLSKMNRMIVDCTENFEKYEYSKTKQDVDKFFWNALCDYYLEIIKDRIYNAEKRGVEPRKSAQFTLYQSLITVIKMMAPIMPHITEAVYQMYFAEKEHCKSIHISEWPISNPKLIDEEAEKAGDIIIAIIAAVRKFKSENKVSLKKEIALTVECPEEVKTIINSAKDDLLSTCNAVKFQFGKANTALEGIENVKISIEMVE